MSSDDDTGSLARVVGKALAIMEKECAEVLDSKVRKEMRKNSAIQFSPQLST